ncbi:unnamed protein product [Adineta ricciae]|uniref:Uncharacterized protein n=1 Tax=Adineta ricciae TaxID=249248 RepID=A0A815KFA7_ADIRI|nr:unnamed protein product [Adineta ricciae]CAF1467100.1 unnamed protein product [Adineta ricciae]
MAKTSFIKKIQWMGISKLILIALPSIVFGILTVIITLRQNSFQEFIRKQDREEHHRENLRLTYQNYINDISNVLFEKASNSTDHHRRLLEIRAKTLYAFSLLDPSKKSNIILYLYETRLLRSDSNPNERLDLTGIDLSNVIFNGSFGRPLNLSYISLANIKATNLVFQWCQLTNAILDNSYMPSLAISNTALTNTSFKRVYAPFSRMHNVLSHRNNFSGSNLSRMHYISNVYIPGTVDFTNTDLLNSYVTFDDKYVDLNKHIIDSSITILNARLPNGVFLQIDSSDLVIDGHAQQNCQSNRSENIWLSSGSLSTLEISSIPVNSSLNSSSCYFIGQSANEASSMQTIDLQKFSTLIDSDLAWYNLSCFIGCLQGNNSNISVLLNFFSDFAIPHQQYAAISTKTAPCIIADHDTIPKLTRFVHLDLHYYSTDKNGLCLVDSIEFRIFQAKKS